MMDEPGFFFLAKIARNTNGQEIYHPNVQIFLGLAAWVWTMSALTWNETAKRVARSRRKRGQGGKFPCSNYHKDNLQRFPVGAQSDERDDQKHARKKNIVARFSEISMSV